MVVFIRTAYAKMNLFTIGLAKAQARVSKHCNYNTLITVFYSVCTRLRLNATALRLACITRTHLYSFDPSKTLYRKTGVYRGAHYFFFIFAQNVDCRYSSEPSHRCSSKTNPQIYVLSRNIKTTRLLFLIFNGEILNISGNRKRL